MPGNSSVAYASYAIVVKSVYDQAWALPDGYVPTMTTTSKLRVTIASDGTVISAQIIDAFGRSPKWTIRSSGRLSASRSSRLFPKARRKRNGTYTINFNLTDQTNA